MYVEAILMIFSKSLLGDLNADIIVHPNQQIAKIANLDGTLVRYLINISCDRSRL